MSRSNYILLGEDDPQYALIMQLALARGGIDNPVQLVTSRQQLINYMAGAGPYSDRESYPLPAAILLGFRLPLLNGFKALRWVRQRREFDSILIAVLSGIEYKNEREVACQLGADCYAIKPTNFAELVRILQECLAPLQYEAAA